nr:MAG TPA: hypothetical protein [Caudoviricetes sp.]
MFCIFIEKHSHLLSILILIYYQFSFSFIFKIYSHLKNFIFHLLRIILIKSKAR